MLLAVPSTSELQRDERRAVSFDKAVLPSSMVDINLYAMSEPNEVN